MEKRGLYPKTMTKKLRSNPRAYLTEQDGNGDTLLHCTGGLGFFQYRNVQINGFTHHLALHFANKDDLERQNNDGATPLHNILLYISNTRDWTTRMFILDYFKKAAEKGVSFTKTDKNGANILHYALNLCDKDENHTWGHRASETLIECFKLIPPQQQAILLYQAYGGDTPICEAIIKGNCLAVKALVELHKIAKVPFNKETLLAINEVIDTIQTSPDTIRGTRVEGKEQEFTETLGEAVKIHNSLTPAMP